MTRDLRRKLRRTMKSDMVVGATVIGTSPGRVIVKLSKTGQRLTNIPLVGGPVSVGDAVQVAYSGGSPIAYATYPDKPSSLVKATWTGSGSGDSDNAICQMAAAGWSIDLTTGIISKSSIEIDPAGKIVVGTSNNVSIMSTTGTYRLWAGNADAASAPFSVTQAGALKSTSGQIGGWNIGTDSLYSSGNQVVFSSATPHLSMSTASISYSTGVGIWAGLDGGTYKFRVGDPAGMIVDWDGSILSLSGTLQSSDYDPDVAGWQIHANGDAEFNNVKIRGTLSAAVFEYNKVSATAGTLGVYPSASKASTGFTSSGSTGTFHIFADNYQPGNLSLFDVDDVLYAKHVTNAGIYYVYVTVTSASNSTATDDTDYTCLMREGSTGHAFPEGTAILKLTELGTTMGDITLSADGNYGASANITMHKFYASASTGWTKTLTNCLRIGNLQGSWGYSTGTIEYGLAVGRYTSGVPNLTWDETNGLRLRDYSTSMIQLSNAGTVYIGDQSDDHIRINSTSIQMYDGSTSEASWSGGTLRLGAYADGITRVVINTGDGVRIIRRASSTDTTVFQADINGDVVLGSPASSTANVLWDESASQLKFRSGTTTQSYIHTDGSYNVVDSDWTKGINFRGSIGGSIIGRIVSHTSYLSSKYLYLHVPETAGTNSTLAIEAYSPNTSYDATVLLAASDYTYISDVQIEESKVTIHVTHPSYDVLEVVAHINAPNATNAATPVYSFSGDTDTGMYCAASNVVGFACGASHVARFTSAGLFINETSNANQSMGITINSTSANDVLSFKHGNVTHAFTSILETDTYMAACVEDTAAGGARFFGATESNIAYHVIGMAEVDSTGKSTSSQGNLMFQANYTDGGTGSTYMPTGSNLLVVRDYTAARFIFEKEGDLWLDAGGGTGGTVHGFAYDEYDDVQLIRALEINRPSRGLVKDQFDEWAKYNQKDLKELGIAAFNDDDDGQVFVNITKLSYLQNGAIWQLHKKIKVLEQALLDAGINLPLLN